MKNISETKMIKNLEKWIGTWAEFVSVTIIGYWTNQHFSFCPIMKPVGFSCNEIENFQFSFASRVKYTTNRIKTVFDVIVGRKSKLLRKYFPVLKVIVKEVNTHKISEFFYEINYFVDFVWYWNRHCIVCKFWK